MNAISPATLEPQAPDALAAAVAALEEDIVFGRLHPRERLTEDELMARFDMKMPRGAPGAGGAGAAGVVERKRNVGAVVRASRRAR